VQKKKCKNKQGQEFGTVYTTSSHKHESRGRKLRHVMQLVVAIIRIRYGVPNLACCHGFACMGFECSVANNHSTTCQLPSSCPACRQAKQGLRLEVFRGLQNDKKTKQNKTKQKTKTDTRAVCERSQRYSADFVAQTMSLGTCHLKKEQLLVSVVIYVCS